jgi:rhomboid family GlyGly-CTERM serine protease
MLSSRSARASARIIANDMSDKSEARSVADVAPQRRKVLLPAGWLLIGSFAGLLVLLQLADMQGELRYERAAILSGEWWRLITAHLVHANARHLLLNLAGLALVAQLFKFNLSPRQWLWIGVFDALCVTLGLLLFDPQLQWYVGLSGVLHGFIAVGAVLWWRTERPALAAALSLILLSKLAWEQLQGALPLAGELTVIVDAHLYGAVGGVLAAVAIIARRSYPRS